MADKIKIFLAGIVLIGGLVGFYAFEDAAYIGRVLGLLVAVVVSVVILLQSEPGRNGLGFVRGAIVEVKKVVWPTRKETVNTTALVMVMVLIMGLLLWGFDSMLGALVRYFTGQGG